MKPLILVDCYNLLFRSHFAHQGLSQDGRPTGAIYGFLRAILTLKSVSPRLVFCWDHGLPGNGTGQVVGWRRRICKTYKANRQKNPQTEMALGQIPKIFEVICLLGYPSLGAPGLEADDVIGIVCGGTKQEILIYSTDQDLYQLLRGSRVRILYPKKAGKEHKIITASDVEKSEGIPVSRWAEYLALGGDASDNIKAVQGWGPKKALQLIRRGVRLDRAIEMQPCEEELKPHWFAIQQAHMLTCIPTSADDFRIQKIIPPDFHLVAWSAVNFHKPEPQPGALPRFMTFCADYGMKDFMAQRHEFFN